MPKRFVSIWAAEVATRALALLSEQPIGKLFQTETSVSSAFVGLVRWTLTPLE